jgi:hypothetical protein
MVIAGSGRVVAGCSAYGRGCEARVPQTPICATNAHAEWLLMTLEQTLGGV